MSLRLIELVADAPPDDLPGVLRVDAVARPDGTTQYRLLVRSNKAKGVLDALEDGTEAIVTTVDTVIPSVEPNYDEAGSSSARWRGEVSMGEMVERAHDDASMGPLDLTLVSMSTLLASAGMVQGNVAVVVGGMVIAPIIGPLLATAFGTALRHRRLVRSAVHTSVVSLGVAFAPALVLGLLVRPDPALELLALRTGATWWDVGIGLAAGVAGATSFAQDARTAMVGVMVAAALVPPVAAAGLCAGSGAWDAAGGAALLSVVNVGAIVGAALATFGLLGVRRSAWETEKGDATEADGSR